MTALHLSRRTALASMGLALGTGTVGLLTRPSLSPSPPVEGSWPLGRGDPQNTAYTSDHGPTDSVRVSWRYKKHLSSAKAPVVADGSIYLGFHDDIVAFVSLDAASGREQWRTTLGEGPTVGFPDAAAAITGETVLAPFGESLFAFDRAGGEIRWQRQFDEEVDTPTVVDGIAYLVVRGSGFLVALDADTGDTRWMQALGEWANGGVAVTDERVYAVAAAEDDSREASAVVALDSERGDRQWTYTSPNHLAGTPAVVDGTVFVSDARGVHAVAADDGTRRWRFEGRPVEDHELSNFGFEGSAPAVADETVYTGAADERIYALDANTGEKRWEFWTWNNVTGEPVVTDDTVYVGSDDSMIYALDTASGERRWEFDTTGRIRGTGGAVVDGRLFISTFSDGLYALEEARR